MINHNYHKNHSIFLYNEIVWSSFISGVETSDNLDSAGRDKNGMQENGKDYINYFVQANKAISLLKNYRVTYNEKDLMSAKDILSCLKGTFDYHGCFPRPEYKQFSYGWVSSMDAPTVMVASQMMYEITQEKDWEEFVHALINYIPMDVKKGGFTLYSFDENGEEFVWPLEYADIKTDNTNAMFVLNGSLLGYLGTRMIAEIYNDEKLLTYTDRVKSTYEKMFDKFHYKKYPWTFYMLNPLTVIPPHYMIFEKELFRSIYEIEKKDLFKVEEIYREEALKGVLQPQFKEIGPKRNFVIRRACAPHPYLIDLYNTKIVFFDREGTEVGSIANKVSGSLKGNLEAFYEGEYIFGEVPNNAESYILLAEKIPDKPIELFEGNIEVREHKNTMIYSLEPSVYYDAAIVDSNKISINTETNEKGEARLVYELPEAVPLEKENYFGVEIENFSEESYNLGILLYDTKGNDTFRSYTELTPGKNLILINDMGFAEIDSLNNIKKIALRIYTSGKESSIVSIGNIHIFNDLFELKQYTDMSEYKISPQ